jgi:hypothetical protein
LYLDSCWMGWMGWMAWTDWFFETSIKICGENVWVYDVCCFFAAMFFAKLVVEICRVILSSSLAIRWGSMALMGKVDLHGSLRTSLRTIVLSPSR